MAYEDIKNDYTEVDPATYINADTADTRANFVAIPANIDAYFHKDHGIGHFTNFTHLIDFYLSAVTAQTSTCGYSIGTTVDDMNGQTDAFQVDVAGETAVKNLRLIDVSDADLDSYAINLSTTYYCTPDRNGTTWTNKIYSDGARTNLLDTLAITGTATAFRYCLVAQSVNVAAGDRAITGYMENLDLQEGGATYEKTGTDGIELSDTAVGSLELDKEVTDSVKLSDSAAVTATLPEAAADGVEFSDATSAMLEAVNSAADGIELSDSAVQQLTIDITVTDGIEFSDVSTGGIIHITVTDGIGFSDRAASNMEIDVSDGFEFSDSDQFGKHFAESLSDIFFLTDTSVNYRGPHVVRNLLDVRQTFIDVSGREDLATTNHLDHDVDNGADFYIRAGSRYLDSIQATHHEFTWYELEMVAGEYICKFKHCRAIKEVFFVNSEDVETQLDKKLFSAFMVLYPKQGNTDNGTPGYYCLFPQQRPPDQIESGELYDYIGVRIMPPTDAAITLRVYGTFTSNPLIDNADENYWSVNYPDLLLLGALMKLKALYEDDSGATTFRKRVEEALFGVDKDIANYTEDAGLSMRG